MKAICTRCQGSGLEPHIETKFVKLDQFWRCTKCGMVANYELIEHTCNPKKPITKLGKAV